MTGRSKQSLVTACFCKQVFTFNYSLLKFYLYTSDFCIYISLLGHTWCAQHIFTFTRSLFYIFFLKITKAFLYTAVNKIWFIFNGFYISPFIAWIHLFWPSHNVEAGLRRTFSDWYKRERERERERREETSIRITTGFK